MPRNPVALFKKGRIDSRPRSKGSRGRSKRHYKDGEQDHEEDVTSMATHEDEAGQPVLHRTPASAKRSTQRQGGASDGESDDDVEPIDVAAMIQRMDAVAAPMGNNPAATDARGEDEQTREAMEQSADTELVAGGMAPTISFGVSELEQEAGGRKVSASALRTKAQLYAEPTREEMDELAETQALFKSNLFKMQMEAMLEEVVVKYSKLSQLEESLFTLKQHLESLPTLMQFQAKRLVSAGKKAPKVHVPLDLSRETYDFSMNIIPPTNVAVVGSFMLKTIAKPLLNVDVCVELPERVISSKDYLNFTYLHKRALYLAMIASHLQSTSNYESVSFTNFMNDPLKPILVLKPKVQSKSCKKFVIRLHVGVEQSTFKLSKLGPDRNALRRAKFSHLLTSEGQLAKDQASGPETATPRYNTRILLDMFQQSHLEFIHAFIESLADATEFRSAVFLLKTWLQQRNMTSEYIGELNGFSITMLLIHLILSKELPREASSYQMFHKVLGFIAQSEWDKTPLALCGDIDTAAQKPDISLFTAAFDVAMVDQSGFVNLLYAMTIGQYHNLKHQATLTCRLLEDDRVDGFDATFMNKLNPHTAFDTVMHIRFGRHACDKYPAQMLDRAGNWVDFARSLLPAIIRRAVSDRAFVVTHVAESAKLWKTAEGCPTTLSRACQDKQEVVVSVALILDYRNMYRLVDIGPDAESPEAPAFRSFWGPKAELRRFQDGRIAEAVVWDCDDTKQHLVVKWIALHALQRHAHIEPEDVVVQLYTFEEALTLPSAVGDTNALAFQALNDQFLEFERMIRRLELPLAVNTVVGVSASFRGTEVFPDQHLVPPRFSTADDADSTVESSRESTTPFPVSAQLQHPDWQPTLEVVLKFEGSSKWPEDVGAIQCVKAAFYVRMSKAFQSAGYRVQLRRGFVDVLFHGCIYRIVISVPQETSLLKHRVRELTATVSALKSSSEAFAAEQAELEATQHLVDVMQRDFEVLPTVASIIHATHSRYRSYSQTCRLVKRWLHSHMFSGHIEDELVDLLCASLYNYDLPHDAPCNPDVGLMRFLHLMSTADFDLDPIFVDPFGDMTSAVRTGIREAHRTMSNKPPLFVACAADTESRWTRSSPTQQILARLRTFSKSAFSAFTEFNMATSQCLIGGDVPDLRSLFVTPMDHYDVVITLDPSRLTRRTQALTATAIGTATTRSDSKQGGKTQSQFKNLQPIPKRAKGASADTYKYKMVPAYDPMEKLVEALGREYQDFALFFYDALGGSKICVSLNPAVKEQHALRPGNSCFAAAVEGDSEEVAFDVVAFAAACQQLGEGLVESVTVNSAWLK
eukprot:m.360554 g.360554  ORF g.360554 m.360554 type:complete len:1322 (-) comp19090_c0_seq1:232-4197(-)